MSLNPSSVSAGIVLPARPHALKGLLSALFQVAFRSRLCLPLIISAGFMLLDLHLRLDVEVEANVIEQEVEEEDEDEDQEDFDEEEEEEYLEEEEEEALPAPTFFGR